MLSRRGIAYHSDQNSSWAEGIFEQLGDSVRPEGGRVVTRGLTGYQLPVSSGIILVCHSLMYNAGFPWRTTGYAWLLM
jgi:hypothetical protein